MVEHVKVIDKIMGGGKSTWAKKFISTHKGNPIMYVTPYLEEVNRFKKCEDVNMYEPTYINGKSKKDNIKELIKRKMNITTTHALFSSFDSELLEMIKDRNYILILDEVVTGYEMYPIMHQDYTMLKSREYIYVNYETGQIYTNDENPYKKSDLYLVGAFSEFIECVENNKVFEYNNAPIVEFPVHIFDSFLVTYVLTYMFDGSTLKSAFEINNIKYNRIDIPITDSYNMLCQYFEKNIETFSGTEFRDLVKVADLPELNKYDKFGDNIFSSTWYKKHGKSYCKSIGDATYNFFRHKMKAKGKEVMYTVYKEHFEITKVRSYTRSFVPVNCRATNKYGDRQYGAYLVNRYLNPIIKKFIESRGASVDENIYALSEMLQWIWRLRIRNGESIVLYIPSKRMRTLLIKWLNGCEIISKKSLEKNHKNF